MSILAIILRNTASGNSDEPSDLDPQTAIGEIEHYIMVSLYEGLVTGDPKTVAPAPGVAERWDISPDGKTYTFHLRNNARWSNGDPVTSPQIFWNPTGGC